MNKKLKIVILCAAGMSSSLIVKSMRDYAKLKNLELDVSCCPSMSFKEMDFKEVDLILVAPQVRGQIPDVKAYVADLNIPVEQIGMREYGLIKGKEILEMSLKTLNLK